MANLKLNVRALPSKFVSDVDEMHNGCVSVYQFETQSTPNSELTVKSSRLNDSLTDYDSIEVMIENKWVPFNGSYNTYKTNSEGITKFRVIVGNAKTGCNTASIRIGDTTANTYDTKYFVRCVDGPRCPSTIGPIPELFVDEYTRFNIYINTGSPFSTSFIRDILLPYYNNNSMLAAEMVSIKKTNNKNTLDMLNSQGEPYLLTADNMFVTADSGYVSTNDTTIGKTVTLVIQEDATTAYHSTIDWTVSSPRTLEYNQDLKLLRERLNAYQGERYRGAVLQMNSTLPAKSNNFKSFLKAVEYGGGSYTGTNGLSDRRDIKFYYDIERNKAPIYYKQLIENALTDLRVSRVWGG